ncbi:MAG: TPM domain-containing protein [Rhodoglobus sp.]
MRSGVGLAVFLGVMALGAGAAHAEDPVDLGGAYVLDTVGAITGQEAQVQAALDDLYNRAHIQLFVVYVDTFTGASGGQGAWADATATRNGLGDDDLLLAIATEDRNFEVSVAPAFPLTDAQLSEVETDFLIPQLRSDDWAGGAIAAAQGYAAAATGVVGPNEPSAPETGSSAPAISPVVPIVGGVIVVGGVGAFIYSRVRKRRADGSVASVPDQMTQKELDQRAGTLLVQLDDSLKTSEQELGFAVAQFGDDATADFTATLKSASDKVKQAFTLRQQLDDATPETAEQKRAMTTQIIQLCEAADQELDAQADAFDDLRKLEKNAPAALAEARTQTDAAKTRHADAEKSLAALTAQYSAAAVSSVSQNIVQADKLLAFAEAAEKKADAAITAEKSSEAAIAVRTAQASVGQVGTLFDAIDALAKGLTEASSKLDAAVADTRQDIAAARVLPTDSGLASAIAAAEEALAAATSGPGDPLGSLAQVEKANAALDQVFTTTRDAQDRIARATAQLDTSISSARSNITSTSQYITTRRGSISETARTRISEADRHLAQAISLSASDPVAALAEAQQANDLASIAMNLASNEVESYTSSSAYQEDSGYSGSGGTGLGGIIGDLVFGNGGGDNSGGGWFGGSSGGSSYRPSRSGGSVFGGSGGRTRSSGFGGSSRGSSSRGSGGGRSRGGRF